ncbi:MAG: FtsX-like permease family protein [Bryobacterales bacterium]|nr:FtsX-like permease family protein [Bryobacterales bacterium]
MILLAWRNLMHDRVRLAVTLTGIVFSLVLMLVQSGLFLGFLETSGNIVERSGADLWITAPGIPHVNAGAPIPERRRFQALAVPGVARADKFILQFNPWKLPSGAWENVQVAGFDLEGGMGGPWNITRGNSGQLHSIDTVVVDELYRPKLGIPDGDALFELNGRRARIAGYTAGIRSFTTSPYIFTSIQNAHRYTRVRPNETTFLLIRTAPGAAPVEVQQRLRRAVPGVDVYTNAEMLARTRYYWIFKTGAGITTLIGVVLGLAVGMVVVAQTIYAATVDHLREFGTLKAMGAENWHIYRVILTQALISGAAGYSVAIVAGWMIARKSESGTAAILLPSELALGTFFLALAMCTGASVLSIRKATSIDPALVFRS